MTPYHPKIITSKQNATIKLAKGLLQNNRLRTKQNKTVIEGTHLIDACIKANHPIEHMLVSQSAYSNPEVSLLLQKTNGNNILVVEDKLYQDIRSLGTGIDIMSIIATTQANLSAIDEDCLILNDVQDSGNVGTLLRTASAIGIKNIICTSATAGVWSPKTLRAGMGAQFSLNLYENISIDNILAYVKPTLISTSSHTDNVIYQQELTKPIALVMGHEGQGVCAELLEKSTKITLPQPNGQESLNVAIAGALCMYEMLRQRSYA